MRVSRAFAWLEMYRRGVLVVGQLALAALSNYLAFALRFDGRIPSEELDRFVQFLPWLIGSNAPQPNDDVRAAYVGLGLQHDRRHVMRATLEGIALNLAWLLPAVEGFVGNEFPFLRFGGGGAQSSLWAQLLADATGRSVHRLAEPRATNARGAAFLAFAALGTLQLADVPSLLQTAQVHEPDPAQRVRTGAALARLTALHPALSFSD